MLRTFSVANYKNFEKEVILDFTNIRDYKFNAKCVKEGLLNKALLVGKNASGKTNLAYALFDIVYTLTDNVYNPMQLDSGSFINGVGKSKEAKFRYEFQNGDSIISYKYNKVAPGILTYESLIIDGDTIFEFDYQRNIKKMDGLKKINAEKLNMMKKLDGTISAFRVIANNTVQKKDSPVSFIMNFVSGMLYYRSCQDGNKFIGLMRNAADIEQYIITNGLVEDFENFINEMTGMNMKIKAFKNPISQNLVQVFPNKELYFHPIASSGTVALELYYYWSKSFKDVSFLYIDEFDAFYHFELAVKILQNTIDNVDVQTIFTSHNTMLVSNDFMRPDCCLKIDNGQIVSFADSTTRELREGHNIEKMLRNGAFND